MSLGPPYEAWTHAASWSQQSTALMSPNLAYSLVALSLQDFHAAVAERLEIVAAASLSEIDQQTVEDVAALAAVMMQVSCACLK